MVRWLNGPKLILLSEAVRRPSAARCRRRASAHAEPADGPRSLCRRRRGGSHQLGGGRRKPPLLSVAHGFGPARHRCECHQHGGHLAGIALERPRLRARRPAGYSPSRHAAHPEPRRGAPRRPGAREHAARAFRAGGALPGALCDATLRDAGAALAAGRGATRRKGITWARWAGSRGSSSNSSWRLTEATSARESESSCWARSRSSVCETFTA